MLANLLPGLREIRAPLVSGYLWLVFFFLAFHDDLPSRKSPGSVLQPIFDLGGDLSTLGLTTVTGVAAYLVGSAVQELWKLLGGLASPRRPLYGEAGARTSLRGRRDIQDAVLIRVQGIRRELFQMALSPGEKGVDDAPAPEVVERELPLIRTLLLGERPELVGELDRIQAEADLRVTVSFPLAFLALFLWLETSSPGWLLVLLPAGLLLFQGYQRYLDAGDLLAKALRVGKADAPALEALATSAKAVLQRVELEGELRREMGSGDGMAAFRLGNLHSSWDDFEAAVASFEFATGKGIVRAYAELGLVHERRGDLKSAERAYRDGDERSDEKARRLLTALLDHLERGEEAREAAKRAEGPEERAPEPSVSIEPPKESSNAAASYRRRMKTGDAKAAINLGLLLERNGDLSGAVNAYQKATELDEEDAQAWLQLGAARSRQWSPPAEFGTAYERALELQEKELGPDHLEVAITLGNLGSAFRDMGNYEKAQELQERALQIKERELGSDHGRLAITLAGLASLWRELGDYEKARELQERALRIREGVSGPNHPELANLLDGLGVIWRELGDYERGRELQERALRSKEREHDPDHLEVANILDRLGNTLYALGNYEKSKELQERALRILERELGPDNLSVEVTRANLSNALNALGESRRALELLQGALEIEERELGPHHLWVGRTLASLGNVWRSLDELEKSEGAFRRALKIFGATPNEPLLAGALRGLAKTLRAAGRATEALSAIEQAGEIQRNRLGNSHPELADTLDVSAEILDSLNQYDPADDARATARAIRRERGLG